MHNLRNITDEDQNWKKPMMLFPATALPLRLCMVAAMLMVPVPLSSALAPPTQSSAGMAFANTAVDGIGAREPLLRSHDVEDIVTESFEVRAGGTLYLELDLGNIEIEVGRRNSVDIEMIRIVRVDSEQEAREILDRMHSYSFEKDRDDVTIESRFRDEGRRNDRWNRGGRNKFRITMRITVPERYNIDFVTGAGNIVIEDLEGEVTGKTGAGNIRIGEMDGSVDITSGAGNITMEGVTESVEVNTGAGNIDLEDVYGFVRARTGAGNISAQIFRQPDNHSKLESGAGNVTVYLGDGIGVYVDAVAAMGSASCDFPLKIEGKFMKKSFEGEVNGGGPDLFMRAGVGNVTLRRR